MSKVKKRELNKLFTIYTDNEGFLYGKIEGEKGILKFNIELEDIDNLSFIYTNNSKILIRNK